MVLLGWSGEAEEAVEVFQGEGADGFRGERAKLGEVARGFDNVGWLIAFAPVGDGSEVGTIGFEKEAVERDHGGSVLNVGGLGVGEVSGEGEDEAEIERGASLGEVSGEAVHDAAEAGCGPLLVEDGEKIVPGVGAVLAGAAVDEDGKLDRGSQCELLAEDLLLRVAWGMVVVVVEADFADGDDARMLGKALHAVEVCVDEQARLVGVDADGSVNPGVALGERDGAGDVVRAVAIADGEEGADAGIVGALDGGVAIGGELGAVEMGVGVEEHGDLVQ